MKILNTGSLYQTLDNLNQAFSDGVKLTSSEKVKIAKWLAGRKGLNGAYSNVLFAPTDSDFKGIKLFPGDGLNSNASISHILGEETLRALFLLNVNDAKVKSSMKDASERFKEIMNRNVKAGIYPDGIFCCGKCSAAYWRNLSAEGTAKNKKALESGINVLKKYRDGKGKWRRFPFFYTVLALTGIDLPSAKAELAYASDVLKRYAKRKPSDKYGKRKLRIAGNALR